MKAREVIEQELAKLKMPTAEDTITVDGVSDPVEEKACAETYGVIKTLQWVLANDDKPLYNNNSGLLV